MATSLKNSPKIVVVTNGKGGVGKTTTAIALAGILAQDTKVLIVDADVQGSLSWWVGRSDQNMGFDIAKEVDPTHLKKLPKLSSYDLVLIDTPPALHSNALATVVAIADYLVLPTPPAPMDLTALIETVKSTVRPAQVPHRVLLTRVDPRCLNEALEAQNTLLEVGVPVFHAFVRAYKAHERAALEGKLVTEWKGKNAREAEADYRRVVDELRRDILR